MNNQRRNRRNRSSSNEREARVEDAHLEEARVEPRDAAVERLPSSPPVEPASTARHPRTVVETVELVDNGWRAFFGAASAFPSERLDERIGEGWTRKQMLAHISAWHDLTHERLGKMLATGQATPLTTDEDTLNARVARQAVGRTGGEVVKDMELSFNRLRRQVARLTDDQLVAHDAWAAQVIAGNTYEHYADHSDDVREPSSAGGRSARR